MISHKRQLLARPLAGASAAPESKRPAGCAGKPWLKPLPARPPPDEGAQLLVQWAGDDGSSREDGRYACALRGGRLHGDWAGSEPVQFSPADNDWRYGEGAYKQRALDHVARFCATLPPPATEGAPAPESKRPAVRAGKPWLDDLGDIEDSEEEES